MKVLWQHRNGKLYALEHDPFGHIIGASGPLDWDDLDDPGVHHSDPKIVDWAETEIRRHVLHRVHPAAVG